MRKGTIHSSWTDRWVGKALETDDSSFMSWEPFLEFPFHVGICPVSDDSQWARAQLQMHLTVDPSLMFGNASRPFFSLWIMILFFTFSTEAIFFIPVKERVKMKKACGAPEQTLELQRCQIQQLTSEAKGRMKLSGEEKNGKRGLFLQRHSSLLPWFPSVLWDSPSSERTNSTEEHLVQYSPTERNYT